MAIIKLSPSINPNVEIPIKRYCFSEASAGLKPAIEAIILYPMAVNPISINP